MDRVTPACSFLLILLIFPGGLLAASPPSNSDVRLEARASFETLFDDDLEATYGVLPAGEVGVSWRLGEQTRFALALCYATSDGNPYYDTPGFDSEIARVTAVPLTLAIRLVSNEEGPLRIVAGLGVQAAWVEEQVPTGTTEDGLQKLDGYGFGVLVTVGPEWRLAGGRHVVSLEFALGGVSAEVQDDSQRHDVDLRGFHLRFGYALALGSTAVQP